MDDRGFKEKLLRKLDECQTTYIHLSRQELKFLADLVKKEVKPNPMAQQVAKAFENIKEVRK